MKHTWLKEDQEAGHLKIKLDLLLNAHSWKARPKVPTLKNPTPQHLCTFKLSNQEIA